MFRASSLSSLVGLKLRVDPARVTATRGRFFRVEVALPP